MISSSYADIPVVSYITSEPSFLSLIFSLSDLPGLILFRHCLLFISPRLCSLPAVAHTQYIAPLFNNNGVPLVNSRDNCAGEAVLICCCLMFRQGLAGQGWVWRYYIYLYRLMPGFGGVTVVPYFIFWCAALYALTRIKNQHGVISTSGHDF